MAVSRLCSVEGCIKPHLARDLCSAHYERRRRFGDALAGGPLRTSPGEPLAWLRAQLEHDDAECLIWPYAHSLDKGYGSVYIDGRCVGAHREMCRLAHGEPPTPEHHAAHNCGNGHLGCVHPKHLRWATVAENNSDKLAHGTACLGESHPNSVLTEDGVRWARSMNGKITQVAMARTLGISRTSLMSAINRETWTWLD